MEIEPSIWSKLHGAVTHFPIALMFVSAFCECASLFLASADLRRNFRFAGTLTIAIGALLGNAAVLSGLIVSKWQVWGHATLLHHHQFVWPAFALMTGLATWRILTKEPTSRASATAYLFLMFLTAALMGGAGYWGGELLNKG